MVKILAQLTYIEGDRTITLTADSDCNTQIIKNALVDFMKQVSLIEENAKAQAELKENIEIEEPLEINV